MSASSALDLGIPKSVFYPSMVVNLQLRLDEGRKSLGDPKSPEELAQAGGAATPTTQGPEVLASGKAGDGLSHLVGIVPRSASIELPAYRQAGKFNFDIEYRDLPLDPRVIRAIGVAVHLGAVPAPDFASGMTDVQLDYGSGSFDSGKRRKSIIETTPENIVLAGLADTIYVEHTKSGSLVKIGGRDLRGIMLDLPISIETLKKLDVTKPISEVVRQIVQDLHPQGGKIEVVVKPEEWPGGSLPSPRTLDDVTRTNLNAIGKAVRPSTKGEAQKVSFWDLITNYCFFVGAVPYFVGSRLFIRPARNLFDQRLNEVAFDQNFPTPFKDGLRREVSKPLVSKRERFAFRRLVFGRDILHYSMERKLAGIKVPVIEAVSWDSEKKKLVKMQFPPESKKEARTTNTGAGGKAPATNPIRVNVPGVKNKKKLLEIAKDLYEEVGRQEIGGSVQTRNLSSFGGSNQDPDLIKLRPGDPIEFRVDSSGLNVQPPPASELTSEHARSREEQVKAVREKVGDEQLARALVAANRGEVADMQRIFRTANVKFDWNCNSGLGISFDFQNFVEARYALEDEVDIPALVPIPS